MLLCFLCKFRQARDVKRSSAYQLHGMGPERPVALELRLAKKLIPRALVRKEQAGQGVLIHITRLAFGDSSTAVERRFDVDQHSGRRSAAINIAVLDRAHSAVSPFKIAPFVGGSHEDWNTMGEVDRYPEIDADLSNRCSKVLECSFLILAAVAHHDEVASTAHHFIKPEIFKMTAVGQIYVLVTIGSETKDFGDQRLDRPEWPRLFVSPLACITRISEPPSKPKIEKSHDKSKDLR